MSPFKQTIDAKTYRRLKRRQQRACHQIYQQFSAPVYNLAYRMLQSPEDAQDISQVSFITAFNKIEQWSQEVAFGFWLRRIVINQSLDLLRKRTPQLLIDDGNQIIAMIAGETSITYDHSHDANHYLKNLSPAMRTIIWLYEVEGFTHQEIGAFFDCSESFSKSRLARAKQQLKQLLNKQKQEVSSYEKTL